jgi:hypothetical protein
MARGPNRAPGLFDVPISSGTPMKPTSTPSADSREGSRIIVAGPAKRGISLPPSG